MTAPAGAGRSARPDGVGRCSLIIATFDRPGDLARCLESVAALRRGFDEILIVDQGDAQATARIVEDLAGRRSGRLNASILAQAEPSLTRARNRGVAEATGDFLFFADDDTTLDEHYVESALECFARHPEVVGLTGYIEYDRKAQSVPRWTCKRLLALLLLASSFRWEVMRSGANSAPFRDMGTRRFRSRHGPVSRDVAFLFGCHFACRKEVFEAGFRFDERLIRWGFGEDVMFSYRVWKHYGHGSLAYCPAFSLRHYSSPEASLTDGAAVRMQVIYRFLFWREEVWGGSLLNALCYLYGQLGFSLLLLRRYRHAKRLALGNIVRSYAYLLAHHREIATGGIDYNRFILEG